MNPVLRCLMVLPVLALAACNRPQPAAQWSEPERQSIAAMSLTRLPPPPVDPTNAVAADARAAALGEKLFSDTRLSANGRIACASCHDPARLFTDGRPRARGIGDARRNAPTLIGAAWSPWQFWDGRADSLWSQAAGPLLDPAEMGLTPSAVATKISQSYRDEFENLFGAFPADDLRVLAEVGKVLAAYERTLRPAASRFDAYADAIASGDPAAPAVLDARERNGLRLFLGRGQCARCHQGPLLTNHGFHNTGLAPPPGQLFDAGRAGGTAAVLTAPLNCRSRYSDAPGRPCPQLEFIRAAGEDLASAFKTPSLRNVAETAPYMHDGRFATLAEVLDHYNRAPQVLIGHQHTELFPLGLSPAELGDLEAFLRALSAVK